MPLYDRHILFVDDDVSLQKIIKHLLEQRGVKVTSADNGAIALQKMQAGLLPDVILADMAMPEMNGLELFRAVRAKSEWTAIPFIVLTAHTEKAALRQALQAGVDDFLTKPFDGERLLLTIYNKTKRIQELTNYADTAHKTLEYIRRDMARMFTHELRTPLVSLNMAIELLRTHRHELSDSDTEQMLDTLQSGVTRLNRLAEQMVTLIQLDTGELQKLIEADRRPGSLWEAMLASANQARTFSHRRRDAEILYNHSNCSDVILAEWRTLRHALAELLANAISFSPGDRPVIVNQSCDEDTAMLTIIDAGPGIPAERQFDLFRRFNQVERELHDQQGIGMGLYLARTIIEATGGTLDLHSTVGQGTTVIVRFPLVK
jgi:two-component system sensor histidine kinase/response regulator